MITRRPSAPKGRRLGVRLARRRPDTSEGRGSNPRSGFGGKVTEGHAGYSGKRIRGPVRIRRPEDRAQPTPTIGEGTATPLRQTAGNDRNTCLRMRLRTPEGTLKSGPLSARAETL